MTEWSVAFRSAKVAFFRETKGDTNCSSGAEGLECDKAVIDADNFQPVPKSIGWRSRIPRRNPETGDRP